MPTRKFALEPAGPKRLEISWKANFVDCRVTVDGRQVGAFSNRQELLKGSTFSVPDGSSLGVRLYTDLLWLGLHITYNGKQIPESRGNLTWHLNQASNLVALLGFVRVVFALIVPHTITTSLISPGTLRIEEIIIGVLYLACSLPIRRSVAPAVWVAMGAAAFDGLFIVTHGSLRGSLLEIVLGLALTGMMLLILIRPLALLRRGQPAGAGLR